MGIAQESLEKGKMWPLQKAWMFLSIFKMSKLHVQDVMLFVQAISEYFVNYKLFIVH